MGQDCFGVRDGAAAVRRHHTVRLHMHQISEGITPLTCVVVFRGSGAMQPAPLVRNRTIIALHTPNKAYPTHLGSALLAVFRLPALSQP